MLERNAYSVNSRLIGGASGSADGTWTISKFGTDKRRWRTCPGCVDGASIASDYRHIIEWLVRQPGAFDNYRYQVDLFPTSRFRMVYDGLRESTPGRASKEYLRILQLAAETGEVGVDQALRELLAGEAEVAITVESIRAILAPTFDTIQPVTMVKVALVDLASFDQLCTEMLVRQ